MQASRVPLADNKGAPLTMIFRHRMEPSVYRLVPDQRGRGLHPFIYFKKNISSVRSIQLASVILIMAFAQNAAALNPAKPLTAYAHRVLGPTEGLPQNAVQAIQQTS